MIRHLFFDPPAIIIEDQAETYKKQLKQSRKRQAERDMMHDAYIDNLFHGQPYVSIFDEYPGLSGILE